LPFFFFELLDEEDDESFGFGGGAWLTESGGWSFEPGWISLV
jgi:hypothetical protein